MARISKKNGSQTVTNADGRIIGNTPGQFAPTATVAFPTLAPSKGDIRLKDGREQRWDGRQWRSLCAEPGCRTIAARPSDRCAAHGGGRRCAEPGCEKKAQGSRGRCVAHGGGRRCAEPGCEKSARDSTGRCKAHGGGRRCAEPGCEKSARDSTDRCAAHGGGRRCAEPGCEKSARDSMDRCKTHGGGRRCAEPGCEKSAESPTVLCVAHGGGRRCAEPECEKSAQGSTDRCVSHWPRCVSPGCDTGADPGGNGLCSWHQEHGAGAVNDLNWRKRVYRLYCVYYPDLGWVKIGVEASKPSKRVKQWVEAGGVLVDEVTLDRKDLSAGRGVILAGIENDLHRNVFPAMFERVDRDLYAAAFRNAGFVNGPTDGRNETYQVEDWSVIWGLARQKAEDADLWRAGDGLS